MAQESLEELFGGKSEQAQEAAEAIGESASVAAACKKLLARRAMIETRKAELKKLEDEEEQIAGQIMSLLEANKLKTIKLERGEQFTIAEKTIYSLPPQKEPEKREKAVAWLKRVGAKELFKEDINAQTLGSFLRERAEEKKPISELIGVFVRKTLSVTGVKKAPK